MVTPKKSGSGEVLEHLIFLMQKVSAKTSASENPIDSFHPFVAAPKNKSKAKKKKNGQKE